MNANESAATGDVTGAQRAGSGQVETSLGPDRPSHRSMWRAAWLQHKSAVMVLLVVEALAAAALIVLRLRIVAAYREFGCTMRATPPLSAPCIDAFGQVVWADHGFAMLSRLAHIFMVGGPVVLGAFVAAPIFTRELSQGTHVFALTQSVRRRSWFTVKLLVLLLPLTVGLLALGFLMDWVDAAVDMSAFGQLGQGTFFAQSVVPAAMGLATFGATLVAGMVNRSEISAVITGLLAGASILVGAMLGQPHLLPADRIVTSYAERFAPVTAAEIGARHTPDSTAESPPSFDLNAVTLGTGYLDLDAQPRTVPDIVHHSCQAAADAAGVAAASAAGLPVPDGYDPNDPNVDLTVDPADLAFKGSIEYRDGVNEAMLSCYTQAGVSGEYTDILPGYLLWPLRWIVSGILTLAALGLILLAARQLGRAATKR